MENQIQKGCSSVSVLKIQQCLNQLSPELNLNEDGIYGTQTEDALKIFQKRFGLVDNGILTSLTWDKIIFKIKTQKPPEIIPILTPEPLGLGSFGLDVRKAQEYLNLILPETSIETDGVFDIKTQVKVIHFQNMAGLNPDGRIDITTWNRIIDYL